MSIGARIRFAWFSLVFVEGRANALPLPETPAASPRGSQAAVPSPQEPGEGAAVPAAKEPWEKPIGVTAGVRVGARLRSAAGREFSSLSEDGELDLSFSGDISPFIGLQAAVIAQFGPTLTGASIAGDAAMRDVIAKIKIHEALNVWLGRMIVPSDRSAFSGPYSMGPWNYPGFFEPFAPPVGPRQGPFGRNDGVTVWGSIVGGVLKYYLGAFNLHDSSLAPLYTTRLNLSVLDPEPAYYQKATYLGEKDILALGLAGQFQWAGSVEALPAAAPGMPSAVPRKAAFAELNADLLFERNLGTAGTLTLESAFAKYFGDFERFDYSHFVLWSYLTPSKLGVGKLQPLFRVQQAKPRNAGTFLLIDAQLGYIIEKHAARVAFGYQRSALTNVVGNVLFFGVQILK